MNTPKFQKSKDKHWIDEKGFPIAKNRLSSGEILAEKTAEALFTKASQIHGMLETFKATIARECMAVMAQVYADNQQDPSRSKGNFIWYNFDRSVKISVKINDRLDFDDTLIELCQNKLNEFLDENVKTKDDFIKQFITDAFAKSRGSLDAKKVMALLKYKSKIENPLFQEALRLLESAIRYPDSKRYFQVAVRNQEGQYDNIDLNFSSI